MQEQHGQIELVHTNVANAAKVGKIGSGACEIEKGRSEYVSSGTELGRTYHNSIERRALRLGLLTTEFVLICDEAA